MKKLIILIALILMSTSVWAGTCPNTQPICSEVNSAININDTLTSDSLRDGGTYYPNSLYRDNGWDDLAARPHPHVTNPALEASDVVDCLIPNASKLANDLKDTMNAHAADATAHATADTVNFPITTADATDHTTLYALAGALLTAFDAHESDDDAGAGSYHNGIEGEDATLTSAVTPTTVAEAATRLTDLKAKYNIHDADNTANVPHIAGNEHQEDATDASGSCSGVADPFLYFDRDTSVWYMFFETIGGGKNAIAYATSPDGLTWTYGAVILYDPALVKNYSYPFVFEYNDTRYMLPQGGDPTILYKFTTFPTVLEVEETVISGTNMIDNTMFYFEGLYWIVGMEAVSGDIWAYSSPVPVGGTWTAHPSNPLMASASATKRPAGRAIARDNYVLFFFHDQTNDAVAMHKITGMGTFAISGPLTNSPIIKKDLLSSWRTNDMHHIDVWEGSDLTGGIAVVDALVDPSTRSIGIYEVTPPDIDLVVEKSTLLNETGGDNNTIVRGLTDNYLVNIDAGLDWVGIGEDVPLTKLHVNQDGVKILRVSGDLTDMDASRTREVFNVATTETGVSHSNTAFTQFTNIHTYDGLSTADNDYIMFKNELRLNTTTAGTHLINTYKGINNYFNVNSVFTQDLDITTLKMMDIQYYYGSSSGTVGGTDWYGVYVGDAYHGTNKFQPTNLSGIWIEKQTAGQTNDYGLVLDGDGVGADIVLGAGRDTKLSNDATDNRLDVNGEGIKTTGTVPSLDAECGSDATITGSSFAGIITAGTAGNGLDATCGITFNAAFDNAPACTLTSNSDVLLATTSTTKIDPITDSAGAAVNDSSIIMYICIGL